MYIITGGAGFIGSALIWKLNSLGIKDLLVVDNLSRSEKWRNLVKRSYADYIHRDKFMEMVRNESLPWKIEGIAHLGACSSTTENDCDFLIENNFHYSRDLCRFALDKGARFINASSAATYGAGEQGFSDSESIVHSLRPLNMYGYSKQLLDLWLLRERLTGEAASLKFFNVYGPNEYHKGPMRSVASRLFGEIGQSSRASLFASNDPSIANGEQKRDFIYIKDVVSLCAWLLLERPDINGIRNVGSGTATSFNDLACAVFSAMGKQPDIRYIPIPENIARNYQNYTCADMSWLAEAGYGGKLMDVRAGVGDYVRNYLAAEDPYL